MDQKTLKKRLSYDPKTGIFRWRDCKNQPQRNGSVAGAYNTCGHIQIRIEGRKYLAHRLAWFYVYGEWPDGQIDHRNGVPGDNRICNLRVAKNQIEQQQNQKAAKNNTSGYIGVYWHNNASKWAAHIGYKRSLKHLGLFDDIHEAAQAYLDAKAKLHTFNPVPRELGELGGIAGIER